MTQTDQGQAAKATPTILSYSRALQSAAKAKKHEYWQLEVLATLLSVGAALLPCAKAVAAVALLGVVVKAAGKLALSGAKKLFRSGERARRYDFYARTLGWPVPSHDRADLVLLRDDARIEPAARQLALAESDYYAHKGPPSTERLLCNLVESMFWTEKLMGAMAAVRWKHLAYAAAAIVLSLAGTVLVQPSEGTVVLKLLGSFVVLLVTVDVFGEARSFSRGEKEVGHLLRAVETEMARAAPSRDEGLRLLIEYNCVLADLPLLPDSMYESKKDVLNDAWSEFEKGLPIRCNTPAS